MKKLFPAQRNLRAVIFVPALLFISHLASQTITFPSNGAPDHRHTVYAFQNAHIVVDADNVIENGTMLIQDGLIIDIGANVKTPKGAAVYNAKGKWIYPSFIDAYSNYGMPEVKRRQWSAGPNYESDRTGAFGWNDALKPETDASKVFTADNKLAGEYRELGFGTVNTFSPDGIARGTSACVTLNAEEGDNVSFVKDRAAACFSFDKGSSRQDYPSSLMGAIALLRQTCSDADWYRTGKNKTEYNITLEAWNQLQSLPMIFETSDKWNVVRADKFGDEFHIQYIFKGSGNEYQRMDEMRTTGGSFILPLNFPTAYDVEDPYDAELIDYATLKHWEMAPLNPSAFEKNRIIFALTASDLKDKKDFWGNLRKAIKYGLSEKEALRSLTTTPAKMLGIGDKAGALKKGMLANFVITNGNIFSEDAIIWENWIKGKQYILKDPNTIDLRGTYALNAGNAPKRDLTIEGELFKLKGSFPKGDSIKEVSIKLAGNNVTISYSRNSEGTIRLSGTVNSATKTMSGKGQDAMGNWFDWNATQTSPYVPKKPEKDTASADIPSLDDVLYPFASYGRTKNDSLSWSKFHSVYPSILIKNATVWTNETDSILPNTDVLITGTTITAIGKNLTAPAKAMIIDGTGKYLTPGIIDEHSHIAIAGGVNEGTQASSAEVRIGDVINPEDIQVYRQLAGGVVGAQLLHGSANPIGGQSAIIKLRWGANAEGMKISYAPGFIKFALGENVKQSNWGDNNTSRFPQTRMGVEQVYYDYFTRAKEYKAQMDAWNKMTPVQRAASAAPRRDLDLEAVAEILDGKRNITCHSYVQSELTMLMHVADSMGFKVNTFTHILEGYKVADIMKQNNVGASSFSDWWAYKYEVKDAIPYNTAILTRMGIVTAVNSDDAEMARRLNQEAAKGIKYGGLSEIQAFKMATLNPAKLLHLDQHMGSIKVGKDADVVLWSDNPTSVYARVLTTIVDGVLLYDVKEDLKLRDKMHKDKARLIQKMIAEKNGGGSTQPVHFRKPRLWDCDDLITDGTYLIEE